jgi:hypothetical protein
MKPRPCFYCGGPVNGYHSENSDCDDICARCDAKVQAAMNALFDKLHPDAGLPKVDMPIRGDVEMTHDPI